LLARLNRRRKNERITAAIDRIGRIVLKLKICATPDAVRGVEGEAAALYWPAYGQTLREEFAFQRRRREPAETEVDTMLSVASSTLSRDIAALLLRHGLHTGIAYLHEDRDQLDPLAWDFIEIFRAALVEGLVAYAINNRVMVPSHFGRNETGAMTMDTEGRERFVRTYEAWLNRPITNRRSGTESLWRGLIEDEIIAFRDSLLSGATFTPYLMDY
jgi:CRISPR-associated protein Cas1